MRIDILTLFPEMFAGPFSASILKRAQEAGVVAIALHDLRRWTTDRHKTVDDAPFGGGAGMVMKPEPLFAAVEDLRANGQPPGRCLLLTPQGRPLTQALVRDLAAAERLILLCGRYEGVDERVREHLADDELSIGDYVLSGGELPAMVLVDAVVRLLPGALGSADSPREESYADGLLEYPHYTRPADFRGWRVPDVLLSGHHAEVERWRREQRLRRTAARRPDLLPGADLTPEERARWAPDSLPGNP